MSAVEASRLNSPTDRFGKRPPIEVRIPTDRVPFKALGNTDNTNNALEQKGLGVTGEERKGCISPSRSPSSPVDNSTIAAALKTFSFLVCRDAQPTWEFDKDAESWVSSKKYKFDQGLLRSAQAIFIGVNIVADEKDSSRESQIRIKNKELTRWVNRCNSLLPLDVIRKRQICKEVAVVILRKKTIGKVENLEHKNLVDSLEITEIQDWGKFLKVTS